MAAGLLGICGVSFWLGGLTSLLWTVGALVVLGAILLFAAT